MAPQIQEAGGRMMFSVIIPAYNRRVLVEQALASVWAQEFKDYEVIVVDDGSTDGTMEMLEAQQREHTVLKVIRQANAGPSYARNRGIRVARGEYIVFLDSDDLWFPVALSTYAKALDAHGRVALLRGSWMEFKDDKPDMNLPPENMRFRLHQDYFEAGSRFPITLGAGLMAVRRDLLHQVEFDCGMECAEDQDLAMRLGTELGFIEIVSPCQIAYHRHPSSASHQLNKLIAGVLTLFDHETAGAYPGGVIRRRDRWRILGRTIRPVSISCLKAGLMKKGWSMYRRLLPWSLREGRIRYLAGFVVMALCYSRRTK